MDWLGELERTVVAQQRESAVAEFPFVNREVTRLNPMTLDIPDAVDEERPALDLDFLAGQPDHPLYNEIISAPGNHDVGSLRLSFAISPFVH